MVRRAGGRGGEGGWVKISPTMVNRRQKIKKKYRLKHLKAVPPKMKLEPKYKWFKFSHLEFCFLKVLLWLYNFFIIIHTFQWTSLEFFNSTFSNRKSEDQQKLAEKITHFTTQFRLKIITHFTNFNSLDIENNMLFQRSQNPLWFSKISSEHGSVWCQK